jgi:flavin reductase (DIM6/NTAB) family NADH-FMN oxidoreductase RutF
MDPAVTYELLRSLTSPVVAVTSRRGDKLNGMISDGAVRASIVPDVPRLGIFIHKFNFTHDLIHDSGRFGLHVLHTGQLELVHRLGWYSGRDTDKLAEVPHRLGRTGVPMLEDCWAWFECTVANVMDTGASTFFMGDVVEAGRGPGLVVLEPAYLRTHISEKLQRQYMAKLGEAQARARELMGTMRSIWRGSGTGDWDSAG